MEKNYVKSIVEGLKSTSTTRVIDSLLKIKSKVVVNNEGLILLRECIGLEYMVSLLRKQNERIIDVTLSALGNCCLDEETNLAVSKLNISAPLVGILKTVTKDSIQGRACRLIGNLAQKTSSAESLHANMAVAALSSLIENRNKNTSYPTLTMAVRAIRILWMVAERREEMLAQNVVRTIAVLLTAECEQAGIIKSSSHVKNHDGIRKSQEELIAGLLKCLGYFTTLSTAQCAEQIHGDGRGYQCLVGLTRTHESAALKCLMNLCFVSSCRPLLGTAGVVECLVGILQRSPDVEWWPEGAARALAHLSGESVNRLRLRHCGGLPLLVTAAKRSSYAMHALLQYVFDDTAFQILINEGLITLLTDELVTYLETMESEHSHVETETLEEQPNQSVRSELTPTAQSNENEPKPKGDMVKNGLLRRRKSKLLTSTEDDLKVVIERDNMIVGFMDSVDSDVSDNSQSDDENQDGGRKAAKRTKSRSPVGSSKKSKLIKMASRDWSASVYWEPKSPEWGGRLPAPRSSLSPQHDLSPWSMYSDQSGLSPDYRSFATQSKRPRWEWSPESGASTGECSSASPYWAEYQWSPSSSGQHSPCSNPDESSDSEQSGRYSPVCSEPESEQEHSEGRTEGRVEGRAAAELTAAQVAQDLDELIMDDEDSFGDDLQLDDESNKTEAAARQARIGCVLVLLFRVSHGAAAASRTSPKLDAGCNQVALEMLSRRECLYALLDYVERCRKPLGRAARILARILSNALCLTSVLKNRLTMRLHSMSVTSKHPTNRCKQCKQVVHLSTKLLAQLSVLAESGYGIGEISYQLLKGSTIMKQTLSVTLPYIVRTEKPLRKYFIECSALNLLFGSIYDGKESLNISIPALSKLAVNLQIKDPKILEQRFKSQIYVEYDPILDFLTEDEIVTFQLDDSSTVEANKVFLCQNSEVFSAMLMGHFKESSEKYVRLKQVTKGALEYLLTLLHFGLNKPKCELETFPMTEKLETNLEVLLLADRFLFDKVKELVSSAILQFQLSSETAHKIYIWSLSDGVGFLCVEAVAHLLTGKMSDIDRTKSFKTILDMKYKEQWLDDIKAMMIRQFDVIRNDINVFKSCFS